MRWLRGLYVANGAAFGVFMAFTSVLLQSRGFDPFLVGLSSGLGALAYTLALPAWGHAGDKLVGARRALQLAIAPAAIFALLYNAPVANWIVILFCIGFGITGGPVGALTDAMAVVALPDPRRQYGQLRWLTSAGMLTGALFTGFACDLYGYWITPWLFAGTSVATLICAQFVPLGRDSDRSRRANALPIAGPAVAPAGDVGQVRRSRFGSVSEALSGRPRIYAILASVFLCFIGVMCSVTFLSLVLSDLGGGARSIGLSYALSGVAEVTGLVFATSVATRQGIRTLFAFSSVGMVACSAAWAVLTDPLPIVLIRFGAGFFFSGLAVSFILTMAEILPATLQATGQTLYAATAFGAAGGVVGFLAIPPGRRVRVAAETPVTEGIGTA